MDHPPPNTTDGNPASAKRRKLDPILVGNERRHTLAGQTLSPLVPLTQDQIQQYQQNQLLSSQRRSDQRQTHQVQLPPIQPAFHSVPTFPRQQYGTSSYLPYTASPSWNVSGTNLSWQFIQSPPCHCGHQCPPMAYLPVRCGCPKHCNVLRIKYTHAASGLGAGKPLSSTTKLYARQSRATNVTVTSVDPLDDRERLQLARSSSANPANPTCSATHAAHRSTDSGPAFSTGPGSAI